MRRSLLPFPWPRAVSAFALALSLTACGGGSRFADDAAAPSGASARSESPMPQADSVVSRVSPQSRLSATPQSATPSPVSSGETAVSQPESTPEAPAVPEVDASIAASPSASVLPGGGFAFDPRHPVLAGVALGQKEADVRLALGDPDDEYTLPEDDDDVLIREYAELTVGYDSLGSVVYAEVSEDGAETGIPGLAIGGDGRQAASTVGVPWPPSASQVLSLPVAGGLLKIDLEPDTYRVLAVKLIGQP